MTPAAAIATGFLLGLASGGICFWSCASVMGPFLVCTAPAPEPGAPSPLPHRWSTFPGALKILGWYNLGRLLAYTAAGLLVSWLILSRDMLPPSLLAGANLATAALLAWALIRPATNHRCWKPRQRALGALTLGLVQGLAPCPPFLTALGLSLTSEGPAAGLLLFLSLFAGTALLTLPLALLEPLGRWAWLKALTRILGALVALYLIITAALLLLPPS